MNDKKKILMSVLGVFILIVAVTSVSIAFFNYTRTGNANTLKTGRIYFNSGQSDTINLTNVFPVDTSEGIPNDPSNVGTVNITVQGDTMYSEGIEYLISATNVTNTVGTKSVPISISATASGTLGTEDEDYFDNREGSTSHIYKVLAKDTISNNDQLMVGYIAKGATGINGTITIKAYLDKDKIAISDTYDGTESDNMGTTINWVNGRTVLTTTEWNSLRGTGISFQVKVEANEGIWTENQFSINDMKAFTNEITNIKSSISKVHFIRMSTNEINQHPNLIDLTDENGTGMVKAWIDNNELYIASPGETYLNSGSGLFDGFSNLIMIDFENINTLKLTNTAGMFNNCSSLEKIDLSSFDVSNVTVMNAMFQNCRNLIEIRFGNFDTGNVTLMQALFLGCESLVSLDLSSFDVSNVTSLSSMFENCRNLKIVNLSSFNTINVTSARAMFSGCNSLLTIYVSQLWNVDNIGDDSFMFSECTLLKGGGTPQTTYDVNHVDKEYARIDGGANSATPGYLTLKAN